MIRFVVALVLLGGSICCGGAGEADAVSERGKTLATTLCAECHAIGPSGQSPHAGAPAFRTLERRLNLDRLTGRLRRGLTSRHPDMPIFRFKREDARALVAYLRSMQIP